MSTSCLPLPRGGEAWGEGKVVSRQKARNGPVRRTRQRVSRCAVAVVAASRMRTARAHRDLELILRVRHAPASLPLTPTLSPAGERGRLPVEVR